MNRWNPALGTNTDSPELDAFLADLAAVCERHGLSIGLEDPTTSFVVETFNADSTQALLAAHDCTNLV